MILSFLLNEGWQIWGIDGDPAADKWVKARKDLLSNNLTLITAKFEELDWNILPESKLVISINSLPFCDPESFPGVWARIKEKLAIGGRFAGHFFGDRYCGFTDSEKSRMTFLTKLELHFFDKAGAARDDR